MEDWQKTHILKNLPDLLDVTIFNCIVIAEMEAENVLSKYDVEKFVSISYFIYCTVNR